MLKYTTLQTFHRGLKALLQKGEIICRIHGWFSWAQSGKATFAAKFIFFTSYNILLAAAVLLGVCSYRKERETAFKPLMSIFIEEFMEKAYRVHVEKQ